MRRRMRLQPAEHTHDHIHSRQYSDTDARRPAVATRHLGAHRHPRGHQSHSGADRDSILTGPGIPRHDNQIESQPLTKEEP